MALHTLIALTAAVAGGSAQDPSMDLQIAAPVLTDTEVVVPQAVTVQTATTTTDHLITVRDAAAAQENKVTAQFRNAKASDVLEWLEKRGINFVVNDGDIKSDVRVTLSVTDAPQESVLDALASALGGHWERRNGIRVFRKGPGQVFGFATTVPGAPSAPLNLAVPPTPFMKFESKDFDKDFAKRMKELSTQMEKQFGPEYRKQLEQNMKDVRAFTFGDGKMLELQGKEREEVMKMAEEARREAMKEAAQARREAMKEAERARAEGQRAREEAQRARVEGQRAREEATRSVRSSSGSISVYGSPRMGTTRTFITPSFPVDGMNMGKFLKSLSSAQKDTQRKRGYVRYDDLTREQKHLLGVRPDGKFEIRIKVNQDEVIVRGE
jgi:hypothetical protein